jgi:hypothetical protein
MKLVSGIHSGTSDVVAKSFMQENYSARGFVIWASLRPERRYIRDELLGLIPPTKTHLYLRMPCPFFFPDTGRFSSLVCFSRVRYTNDSPPPAQLYSLIKMLNSMALEAHELRGLANY